jgi:hypothetical protein
LGEALAPKISGGNPFQIAHARAHPGFFENSGPASVGRAASTKLLPFPTPNPRPPTDAPRPYSTFAPESATTSFHSARSFAA